MYKKIITIMLIIMMQPIFACIDTDLDIQKDVTSRIRNGINSDNPADLDDAIDYTKFIIDAKPLDTAVEDQLKKNLAVAMVNKARKLKAQGDIDGASGLYTESHLLLTEVRTIEVNKVLDIINSESPTPIVKKLTYDDISDDDAKRFFVQGEELEAGMILSKKAEIMLKKKDFQGAVHALDTNKKIVAQNIEKLPSDERDIAMALASGKHVEAQKAKLDDELDTDKIVEFNNKIKQNLIDDYGALSYHITTVENAESIMKEGFGGYDDTLYKEDIIHFFTGKITDGTPEIKIGRGGAAVSIKEDYKDLFETVDGHSVVENSYYSVGTNDIVQPKEEFKHMFPEGRIPPKMLQIHIMRSD